MNTKNAKNLFKTIATLVGIAGASTFLGLPAKAEVNPNASIFGEYPYNRANVAQTNPGVTQPVQDTTTPGVTQPVQDTTTPGVTQPTQQDTTTPGVTQPVQDTTTPGTVEQDNDDDNGVRALW
ncbi:hypothetical protein [Fischerella sp. PCC 9605]|uniref:hypothetical protein n=1 Tax=Fischerella sp. PCC 9605 TaxID=1173024 RepID=UPI00047EE5A5|nr:hypothetical protein [Fischerella sp. PCC 9605]